MDVMKRTDGFLYFQKLSALFIMRATGQMVCYGCNPEKYSFSVPRYLLIQTLAAPRSTPVS